jgi:hypothetical protein
MEDKKGFTQLQMLASLYEPKNDQPVKHVMAGGVSHTPLLLGIYSSLLARATPNIGAYSVARGRTGDHRCHQ